MPDRHKVVRFVCASGIAVAISAGVMVVSGRWLDLSLPGVHISVGAIAYFTAARVNYELQRYWVFRHPRTDGTGRACVSFLFINGSIALLVACLSAALMKWQWLAAMTGDAHAVTSLLLAAITFAPTSFLMTRKVMVCRPTVNAAGVGRT